MIAQPESGPGSLAVRCGAHAFILAESLSAEIKSKQSEIGHLPATSRIHLFIAGPNALTFFLGQRQPMLGRVVLYEFDFNLERTGSYCPAVVIPGDPPKGNL